jgi:hypothetical protein
MHGIRSPVSASMTLVPMGHRSFGRCVSHDADLGLRLPLVELAEALTPGCRISPLRCFLLPDWTTRKVVPDENGPNAILTGSVATD